MMKRDMSIKFRLTLWYLFFLIIVLMFFSGFSYLVLNRNVHHINNNAITTTTISVKDPNFISNNPLPDNMPSPSDQSYHSAFNYVINKEQMQSIQSDTAAPISILIGEKVLSIDQKTFITPEITGTQEVWLYYRLSNTQPGYYEILVFTQQLSEIMNSIEDIKGVLIIVIPVTIVVAGVMAYFLAKRMLKPVENITQTAQEIQNKDLTRRIEVKSNDELGKLARTLNQAFEHIQQSFEREKQFTNDASHELQTPLAIMQGEATLALSQKRTEEEYQKALESISQEVTHMYSIVSKLLTLARADNDLANISGVKVDLSKMLEDISADILVLSEKKQVSFQADLQEHLMVNGEEVKLRELFLNLLDNSIKFTHPGGKISLIGHRVQDSIQIIVKDTGIGISEEHLPHIFERFFRVNRTHSQSNGEGSGLGLAICKRIVEGHKGQIMVESQVGEGSTFTVILPLKKE